MSANTSKRPNRYCSVKHCEHFNGIKDPSVGLFKPPKTNNELRKLWEQSLSTIPYMIPNMDYISVCQLHFESKDLIATPAANQKFCLRYNAVPVFNLNKPLLPTEKPNYSSIENVTYSSNEPTKTGDCVNCIRYQTKLKQAELQIIELQNQIRKLKSLKETDMSEAPFAHDSPESAQISRPIHRIKCESCHVKFDQHERETHLCFSMKIDSSCLPDERDTLEDTEHDMIEPICIVDCSDEEESIPPPRITMKMFACAICDESFERAYELGEHMHGHTDPPKPSKVFEETVTAQPIRFKCKYCRLFYRTAKGLHRHVATKHWTSLLTFECFLCKKILRDKNAVQMHLRQEHKRDVKCEICKESLTSTELNSHLCGTMKTQLPCEYCQRKFDVTIKLLEHLETVHTSNKRMIQCGLCTRFFPMEILKNCHQATHGDSKDQVCCQFCSKKFANKEWLNMHIRRTHNLQNSEKKTYLCEECGQYFKKRETMRVHKMKHHAEVKFQCSVCDMKFISKDRLDRHFTIHQSSHDKYICEECGKELSSKLACHNHKRRVHGKRERKYACGQCEMKFYASKDLRNHQRKHSNIRKYQCQFCDSSYKYPSDLNKHLKTHVGEKTYECDKCSKRFKYYMELKKHSYDHYQEEKEQINS